MKVAGREVVHRRRIAGGDINDAFALELDDGTTAFLKTRAGAAPGEYATEAAGLRWLGEAGALVPEVLDVSDAWLALEWLERERADEDALGRRLAGMHRSGADHVGAGPGDGPLRIGPLEFPRGRGEDWPTYYGEALLAPLARRAGIDIDRVIARLPELAGPEEPPSRLHGDLWSGNVFGPYLIDPAAYGGHREIDLAMLKLFGAPSPRLLAAYDEVFPLEAGHADRVGLYQLFPLLVHAVLFGGGYVAQAQAVARRYG